MVWICRKFLHDKGKGRLTRKGGLPLSDKEILKCKILVNFVLSEIWYNV